MNAAQNRFKQNHAAEGLAPAAPSLHAQAGTGAKVAPSRSRPFSAAALAASVGAI
jgi:hypothetical protein